MEVAPDAQPPVCRMMDHGKFRYQQKKKSHGAKKHSVIDIKEVKMGSRTDPHDVTHKVRSIRQFIGKDSEDPIRLRKDIQGITGATISSRGMTDGVRKLIYVFAHFYHP